MAILNRGFSRARLLLMMIVIGMVGAPLFMQTVSARADSPVLPPGPDRFTTRVEQYTSYRWWLVNITTNLVDCEIFIEHDGLPTPNEVYSSCGQTIYNTWVKNTTYYLHLYGSGPAERIVPQQLPPPTIWLNIKDCAPDALGRCTTPPVLVLTGQEYIEGETVIRIEGTNNGVSFACPGATCEFALLPTAERGDQINFWAYSSYGDSSHVLNARIRVVQQLNDSGNPVWAVDVLSPQWIGSSPASCALAWESFPAVAGPSEWLTTPKNIQELHSEIDYAYLAGQLIQRGAVDASTCDDGGLYETGVASQCGLTAAHAALVAWQNSFDDMLYRSALQTETPAHLLKNLFGRESQFWPGKFPDEKGVGLGQLTEDGADVTLLWNPGFYYSFCPGVLDPKTCAQPYSMVTAKQQSMLRGALVASVDARCTDCAFGVDMDKARYSVNVFAETLQASCAQTGNIIRNVYGQAPGDIASYEDLWKLTLVNYNAGAGCLYDALRQSGGVVTWESVSAQLSPACQPAIAYVEAMSR